MNLYFLSLLKENKVRRKNKCSFFEVDSDFPLENSTLLRKRFNIQDGDIIRQRNEDFGFNDGFVFYVPHYVVDDNHFHPLYWSDVSYVGYSFSPSILGRIYRSNLKTNDSEHFIFSKVKIGKFRFNINVKPPYVQWDNSDLIRNMMANRELEFWGSGNNVFGYW